MLAIDPLVVVVDAPAAADGPALYLLRVPQGDAFIVVFHSPASAIAFCLEVQVCGGG